MKRRLLISPDKLNVSEDVSSTLKYVADVRYVSGDYGELTAATPRRLDNLTVPAMWASTFVAVGGGV